MKSLLCASAFVASLGFAGLANAASHAVETLNIDTSIKVKDLTDGVFSGGSLVKAVHGVWTYNAPVVFHGEGYYQLDVTDFNFNENDFDFMGAMISTATEEKAAVFYENGSSSRAGPVSFQVSEEESYWVSIFAITDYSSNTGALGLEISSLTEVPNPPAMILMASALLGLGAYARKKKKIAQ